MRIPHFLRKIPILGDVLPEEPVPERLSRACGIMGYSFSVGPREDGFASEIVVRSGNETVIRNSFFSDRDRPIVFMFILDEVLGKMDPEIAFRERLVRRYSPGKDLLEASDLMRRVLEAISGSGRRKVLFGKHGNEILMWITGRNDPGRFFWGWTDPDFLYGEIMAEIRKSVGGTGKEEVEMWLEARGR